MRTKIITDSTADLPRDILLRYDALASRPCISSRMGVEYRSNICRKATNGLSRAQRKRRPGSGRTWKQDALMTLPIKSFSSKGKPGMIRRSFPVLFGRRNPAAAARRCKRCTNLFRHIDGCANPYYDNGQILCQIHLMKIMLSYVLIQLTQHTLI